MIGRGMLLKHTCVGLSVLIWQLWPVSYGTSSNEMLPLKLC